MATIEEMTAAQAFQYKTSALTMFLNNREGFDPVTDGFHAELFKYAYIKAVRYNEIMTRHNGNPLGIEFKSKSNDQYTMITPDSAEPGRFRLSFFDKQGFYSHTVHDTIPKATEEMISDGFFAESKGILSQLSKSPEFEIGNRVSTLIGQLNMGKITHQEFSDQRQAIHDEVKERTATMNMIINDRGETVAAVGNEISIARAKVRWPDLIEKTHDLFMKHPHDLETQLINQIAAQGIQSTYEAQAVLDAAILPITESHRTYKRERIVIDPEKYSAMFAPTKFNIGDPVTYTNPQGVVFEDKTILDVEKSYGEETRYFYTPTDTPWYSVREKGLQNAMILENDPENKSILNSVQDAEYIIPIYAKTDSFFETVQGSGNAPDKLTLSDEGKEQVYAFVLASRMVLPIQHIKELETLYAHGDKGVWIQDVPPKSYETLNNISMRQLDEGKFDVNQKMLAHSLSIEIKEYNELREKYFLVKGITPPNVYPSLCITESGKQLVETAHIVSKKIIEERKALIQDAKLLSQLEQLFPQDKADQDGEVTIDLIPPNGKDFYERIYLRPIEDSDILPPNSYTIKHFTASPATGSMTSDPEHIKHEFTFAIKDNKISPYWMQDGAIYHDAMSHKSNGIYKAPNEMKQEMDIFVSDMLQRIETRGINTGMTDPELIKATRQARKEENALTDSFLEGKTPETDVVTAMEKTNTLVDTAIERGLIHAPFDDFDKEQIKSETPTHLAYVRISDNHIVGYLSENKLITTKLENALDVTNHPATINNIAKDLLKSPHPLDHHGALKVKLVQYHKNGQYISGVSVPENDNEQSTTSPPFNIGDRVIISSENLRSLSTYNGDNSDDKEIVTRLSNNKIQGTVTGYNQQFDTAGIKFDNESKYNDGAELLIVNPSKNLTNLTHINANKPTYPALTKEETQELSNFTSIIKHNYPEAKTENLHKLCNIASDMSKYITQNAAGTLSDEKFNSLTDHQELQIKELTKDLPGTKVQLHFATETRAIILIIPEGPSYAPCSVPEIPKNKLELPQEISKTAKDAISKKR